MAEAAPVGSGGDVSTPGRRRLDATPARFAHARSSRILLVGPVFSQHVVRHANLLATAGFNVHVTSASSSEPAGDFAPNVVIHRPGLDESPSRRTRFQGRAQVRVEVAAMRLGRVAAGEAERLGLDLSCPALDRSRPRVTTPGIVSPEDADPILRAFGFAPARDIPWLTRLIDDLRPDLLHSLTVQYGGYPVMLARRHAGRRFPCWVVGNWGADVHYWANVPGHAPLIRDVLSGADYLFAVCQRDVSLSRANGFTGRIMAVETPGGGWDLATTARLRAPGATSARRDLVVKGYDGLVGRALVALRAVAMAADAMAGRRLVILAPDPGVGEAAREVGHGIGIEVAVNPRLSYEDLLRALGRARILVGLSVTDALPTMALESMMMGAFPVHSDTGALDELVAPGRSGLLVPPEDPIAVANAIRRAMSDDRLVDDGVAWNDWNVVPRFDAAALNRRIVESYERVIATERPVFPGIVEWGARASRRTR